MSKFSFFRGWLRHLFNRRVSSLAFVSADSDVDKSVVIYRGAKIKNTCIKSHTYVSAHTEIENAEIGKYCSIADHCRIGMADHSTNRISTSPLFSKRINACKDSWVKQDSNEVVSRRVAIGNDVWIGSHALVLGGIKVGDGAVIGAGAVVTHDVLPYAIVGGVPAKTIRFRFDQHIISELLKVQWWDLPEGTLKQAVDLFQKEDFDVSSLCTISRGIMHGKLEP